jgi:signal transduction histidine kinase
MRITRTITVATEFARRISSGQENIALEPALLTKNQTGEITILLATMQKMAVALQARKNEIKLYIKRIEHDHDQQKLLDEQLKLLNEELEQKVAARTRELYETMTILKQTDEIKSQFLTNMSHELRTPLSSIIYTCQAIDSEILGSLNEVQHKHIQNMLDSGTHLLQLINDILDIAKIESGKMTISPGVYTVAELIEDSISIVKSLADRKYIAVSFDNAPAGLLIKADAAKFKQVMYNLLSNAIKFTPENGQVTVGVTKGEQHIKITVKDNGIGIREEDQNRVFAEFEQVENSYEKTHEGTGLGLPLAKKLVELHGGEIFLISKFGEGTEVFFSLPLYREEASEED